MTDKLSQDKRGHYDVLLKLDQLVSHLFQRLETVLRILVQQFYDDVDHVVGEVVVFEEGGNLVDVIVLRHVEVQLLVGDVLGDLLLRRLASEQLEQDRSEGVDVALEVDLAALLREVAVDEVLDLVLGLVDPAVALVYDLCEL